MQALIQKKSKMSKSRVHIIPNWGDIEEIKPTDREDNEFITDLNLEKKTIIQFSGNIGRTHDVETILSVARSLKDRDDIVFLFIGYGGKTSLITDAIHNENLQNIIFLPRQPREKLNHMLSCSDATIISFPPNMGGISVPSRMYNILAAGVPIIALSEADTELSLMISENQAGWVINPGDANALSRLIVEIAESDKKTKVKIYGKNGQESLKPAYTLERVKTQFENLIYN